MWGDIYTSHLDLVHFIALCGFNCVKFLVLVSFDKQASQWQELPDIFSVAGNLAHDWHFMLWYFMPFNKGLWQN